MSILKKFIGADQVDGSKILILNNEAIRAKNAAGSAVSLFKLTSSDVLEFAKMPRAASGLVISDNADLTTKKYVDDSVAAAVSGASSDTTALSQRVDGIDTRVSGIEADYGVAGGLATLDGNGKVPVSQLPSAIMEYQGLFNADAGSPALANGAGNADDSVGDVYRVSVAGSYDFGAGAIALKVGDFVILNASKIWERAETADVDGDISQLQQDVSDLQDADLTFLKLDGSRPMEGDLDVAGYAVKGVSYINESGSGKTYIDLDGTLSLGVPDQTITLNWAKVVAMAPGTEAGDAVTFEQVLLLDGSQSMANDIDMAGNGIMNLRDAQNPTDAVTMQQVVLRDGSQAMTGSLDLAENSVFNVGTISGSDSSSIAFMGDIVFSASSLVMNASGAQLKSLADGVDATDAVTKQQVLLLDGSQAMVGALDMGGQNLTNAYSVSAVSIAISGADPSSIICGDTLTLGSGASVVITNATSGSGILDTLDGEVKLATLTGNQFSLSDAAGLQFDGANQIIEYSSGTKYKSDGIELVGASAAITGLAALTGAEADDFAAPKGYVDAEIAAAVSGINAEDATFLKIDGSRAMTAGLDMGTHKITNVVDPTSAQDAATKKYVDDLEALDVRLDGSRAMTGSLAMGSHKITGLQNGSDPQDAVAYSQLAAAVSGINAEDATFMKLDGSRAMSGNLDMGGHGISSVSGVTISGAGAGTITADDLSFSVSGTLSFGGSVLTSIGNGVAADDAATIGQLDAAVSGIEAELDTLAVEQLVHESFTLAGGDITNGYIDVANVVVGQPMIMVGRVVLLPTEDFTVGNNGASARKRITWAGAVAAAGAEALESGDIVHVYYHKSVNPFV